MSTTPVRFESLLEAVPDALVGMDQAGAVLFVNHQTELLFGYDRDDLVGRHIETLVPETLWQVYSDHKNGYFADPRTTVMGLELELSGRYVDGTQFPLSISLSRIDTGDMLLTLKPVGANNVSRSVSPIRDENLEIIGASTVTREVTSQAQALEASRSMIESSLDSWVTISPAGDITDVNEATVKVTGFSRQELIGTAFSSYFTESDRANEIYQLVFTRGMAVDYPLTMRHRDGRLTDVLYNASVHRDGAGKVLGVFAAARDVTKLKEVEALEASRSMIESNLDSLVTISPAGKITDVNEATVKVTGFSRQELIGTAFSSYFTEPDRANEIYQLVFTRGMAVDYPLTMRHRDGRLTDVRYNASVHRDGAGNVLGVFAAARDVTKLKEALEASRSMIESSLDSWVAIDPAGRITGANEAAVTVTGVSREELIGTAFSSYFTEPDRANEIYQLVFTKGMAVDYPLTLRDRDGRLTDVLYNASVYRGAGGNVLGVFAAARDVTKQRQARRDLVAQQAKELGRLADLELFERA